MSSILTRLNKTQLVKASVLTLTPFLLMLKTGEWLGSISAYYHSAAHDDFIILLVISALMYADDGIYRKNFWNITIGLSLIGVAYFDLVNHKTLHYIFAGYFFIGTCLSMIIDSSKKQRPYKIAVCVFILIVMCSHFIFDLFSLLVAEWIATIPMSLHFIGESSGKID